MVVGRVDFAVAVVVDAVAAGVHLALAGRDLAEAAASALGWIAGLAAGTERAVGGGDTGVDHRIAGGCRASDAVVGANRGRARGTAARIGAIGRIAGFDAVAELAIAAHEILRLEEACARGFLAGIHGAADAVVAHHGLAWNAACHVGAHGRIAGLRAIAREWIVAEGVFRDMRALAGARIAGIRCAGVAVVAVDGHAVDAHAVHARFHAIAEVSVRAVGIGETGGRRDTSAQDHIAFQTGGTELVIGQMLAGVGGLVADLDGACDAVVRTREGRADHTACGLRTVCAADLRSIAGQAVIAYGVVGDVIAFILRFIATVRGARTVVIAG